MNDTPTSLSQLRQLIGARVRYLEELWQVIEVLDDGPALILENLGRRVVQQNQYGEGHRRVPHRVSVPVFNPDERSLSPDFRALTVERHSAA